MCNIVHFSRIWVTNAAYDEQLADVLVNKWYHNDRTEAAVA